MGSQGFSRGLGGCSVGQRCLCEVIEGYWGLCEGHRRFRRLLGGLKCYEGPWGSCLFNGDPRRSKKDHRAFSGVLEGA